MHLGWSWASATILSTVFTLNTIFFWLHLFQTSAGWSYLSLNWACRMVYYVSQQLSQLPLRQHVQILCTSPLLVQMYDCTEELWICWSILSGTVLLWQHLVAYSSQTWVYWRASRWWFLGCREARYWQSGGQSLIPQYCTLCSSLTSLTTCCLLECGPIDVSIPLDASTSTDDI